jgi:phage-related protein
VADGFEVAKGFLRIVADYRQADQDVDKFTRDVNGRLHDAQGRYIKEGEESGKGYVGGLARGMSSETGLFGGIGNGFASTLLSSFKPLLMGGMVEAVSELAPLLAQSLGALALIPAAAGAAGLGIGALALGTHGLGDAFSAMGQKATGGASSLDAVNMAERRLSDAQRSAKQAQEDLTRARKEAKEANEDLALALNGARLDERAAIYAVKDAELALQKAQLQGDPEQIARMQLAYDQASQSLDEAKDHVEDLTDAKTESDTKGVEGSDQVQAALERQRKALLEVTDAQKALTKAQTAGAGGVDKFADALAKLSPAAAGFVMAVKGLMPAFTDLQLGVQEKLFSGLGNSIKSLANAWLPSLRSSLGIVATGFNGVAKDIFSMLTEAAKTPGFKRAMDQMANGIVGVAKFLPGLIKGLGILAQVGAPYIEKLGQAFGRLGDMFASWMDRLAKSGQLDKFIQNGLSALSTLAGLFVDLGRIAMGVMDAMGSATGSVLGPIGELVGQLAAFVESPAGKGALTAIFSTLSSVLSIVGKLIMAVLPPMARIIDALGTALAPILTTLGSDLIPIIADLASTVADALVPVIEALAPALHDVLKALMPVVKIFAESFGQMLVKLAPVLAKLATSLGQVLTDALVALLPVFEAILPELVDFVGILAESLMPIIDQLAPLFEALLPAITPLIEIIGRLLITQLRPFMAILPPIAQAVGVFLQVFVLGITPIAQFVGWLEGLINTFLKILPTVDQLRWAMGVAWDSMVKVVGMAIAWVVRKVLDFVGAVQTLRVRVRDGIRVIVAHFQELRDGIVAKAQAAINWIKGIPGKIGSAFGNFGSLLVNKGKDLITGLWNGIKSMGGWLKDQLVGWVTEHIPGPIAKALGIASPSKVMADAVGRHIPTGIVAGAQGGAADARRSLANMASSLVPSAPQVGGARFAGAPGAAMTGGGVYHFDLNVGGQHFASFVLDTVRGEPKLIAAATDEGRRTRGWSHPARAKR